MKTITQITRLKLILILLLFFINAQAQRKSIHKMKNQENKYFTCSQKINPDIPSYQLSLQQFCNDTVYSVPQNALYFCYGGNCSPHIPLDFEISGSHGAGATIDSVIVWLMTDDKDGSGPLSSLPDSMLPGHDIHHSANRAKWLGGSTPSYVSLNPINWISPFSFEYILPDFWADSGRAICFTPIAFDSIASNHSLYELDSCFGYGHPIQKIVVKSIYTDHFYSCDSGVNHIHLITKGGLPQYNHYNGYGDTSKYTVTVNSVNYNSHYNDTLIIPGNDINFIMIEDSLAGAGIADGCVIYYDTLILYPQLNVTGLLANYYDNSPNDTFSVSPVPSGAMRIDFLCSDPASNGIYLLNAHGDTVFSKYPLGNSVGLGNIADINSSLFIYDIPMHGGPFRIVATNDGGTGWQDSTCNFLPHNGHLRIYDLSSNTPLSGVLFPIGDGNCGAVYMADTFGVYNVSQYNKTQLATAPSLSLSDVDSLGNAIYSPSIAGMGSHVLIFTYNDTKSGLCDKDTSITITISSSVGIQSIQTSNEVFTNNPVHDQLFIKQDLIRINKIELVDVTGKIILFENLNREQTIDVSSIAKGVYFIKLYDEQNALFVVRKIVKE